MILKLNSGQSVRFGYGDAGYNKQRFFKPGNEGKFQRVVFFVALKNGSMILVDGGLVANIPVKVAFDLGADFVIAVNTTSDLHPREELDLPWPVADQVISIPMKLLK